MCHFTFQCSHKQTTRINQRLMAIRRATLNKFINNQIVWRLLFISFMIYASATRDMATWRRELQTGHGTWYWELGTWNWELDRVGLDPHLISKLLLYQPNAKPSLVRLCVQSTVQQFEESSPVKSTNSNFCATFRSRKEHS